MTDRPVRINLYHVRRRMPANTVKVDRTTRWGNVVALFTEANVLGVDGRRHSVIISPKIAVAIHRELVLGKLARDPHHLDELRGKNLACWCELDAPCHADVLLDLANK